MHNEGRLPQRDRSGHPGFALTALPLSIDGGRAGPDRAAPALGRDNAAHGIGPVAG